MGSTPRSFPISVAACALLALGACTGGAVEGTLRAAGPLSPSEGSMAGYYPVELDTSGLDLDAAEVTGVRVGPLRAVLAEVVAPGRLRFFVQGSPEPGAVDVVLEGCAGDVVLSEAFTYLPPVDARFASAASFGASLSQGVQRTTPSTHGGFMSPGAQVARQIGAFMPLPLVRVGLFPQLSPAEEFEPADHLQRHRPHAAAGDGVGVRGCRSKPARRLFSAGSRS